ncbi:MAG TPA: cytochrome c [Acidobacteriaceae bacterium]|jgi:mono/diheme cytochrome c family protein|nr:cytochrome c [Acidobacteriaceae bacterium]
MSSASPLPLLLATVLAPVALLTGCHSTPGPVPLDQLNPQQLRGHQVFAARCSGCHHDREDGPLHGPSLRGVFRKPYLPSGAPANNDRVSSTLAHGRNMMPPQPMDLQDLDDLLAYLHTL